MLSIQIFVFIFLSSLISAQAQQVFEEKEEKKSFLNTLYLESKNELKDYILDTGDVLRIEFNNAPILNNDFVIDAQGEIFFKRIKDIYVRGLTVEELTKLLEERFNDFMINPDIIIRIKRFKSVRVSINGEIRKPGVLEFPPQYGQSIYSSPTVISGIDTSINFGQREDFTLQYDKTSKFQREFTNRSNLENKFPNNKLALSSQTNSNYKIKTANSYVNNLSDAIRGAGGLTSYSDISKIEIIREIPIGK